LQAPSRICNPPATTARPNIFWYPSKAAAAGFVTVSGVIAVTAPKTIAIIPAAGPLIVSSELLTKGVTIPPIIAVNKPDTAGQPLATEIPMHRGNAIRNTRKPDTASRRK
jgi:hypothetical protein